MVPLPSLDRTMVGCGGRLWTVLPSTAGSRCGVSGTSGPGPASSPSADKSDSDREKDRAVRAAVSGRAGLGGVQGLAWVGFR